ncbi:MULTISPECIES: hypothetical protein [Bacillus cereus group]|uniref:Uncharacterized protein n=1 Tax=Bacillus thuringiensis TaxID=1428 RepID=A0A9X6WSI4_BACTU|nr:hypothetical protein [Bacillus thuringiensis]PFJ42729.1 hypothetical protein COJ15_05145 [Bacillus thuringiensis]
MVNRIPIVLMLASSLLVAWGILFSVNNIIYVVSSMLIFVSGGMIIEIRRKKYNDFLLFLQKEGEIVFIMLGVLLFSSKFYVENPWRDALHLLSLSMLLISIGIRRIR